MNEKNKHLLEEAKKALKEIPQDIKNMYSKDAEADTNYKAEHKKEQQEEIEKPYDTVGFENLLIASAFIVYFGGFIIGIALGNFGQYRVPNWWLSFSVWIPAFLLGSFFIAMGKIIELLGVIASVEVLNFRKNKKDK